MPKLANKELQKRKLEMAARSRAAVAKKELVQFRIDAEKIVGLYEVAAKYEKHMGTMLREWVSERLARELSDFSDSNKQNLESYVKEPVATRLDESYGQSKLRGDMDKLKNEITDLNKRFERMEAQKSLIKLSAEQSAALAEAILNPSKPNKKTIEAARRYKKVMGK